MNRLIIVGSARNSGRSSSLGHAMFEHYIEKFPEDELSLLSVADLDISDCIACDACKIDASSKSESEKTVVNAKDDRSCDARCPHFNDDMNYIYELIDSIDELIVVAPLYFAGPTAQFKALLDRFQPYYWTGKRRTSLRHASLHIVGEGSDPFGYEPLVTIVQSALYTAGFKLEKMYNWVGKIAYGGSLIEIAECEEIPLAVASQDKDTPNTEASHGQTGDTAARSAGNAHGKAQKPSLNFDADNARRKRRISDNKAGKKERTAKKRK